MNPLTAAQATRRAVFALSQAGALLLLLIASGQGRAQPLDSADVRSARGMVKEYTTAPRGEIDGATLDDGTWLHWPPHMQDRFTEVVKKGARVRATGRMETGPAGDSHFEVQSVTNLSTNASAENPDFARGPLPAKPRGRGEKPLPPPQPRAGDTSTVRGRVDRMTTAPRGEVDGAVLDDGTWLHWPPHMQDRFTDVIKRGDRVRATGRTETGPAGDTHFEVQSVTNLRSDATADNPDYADGPPPPRRIGRVGPASRTGDREQRLRDLEDQLDQLRREIERLRRER